MQSKRLARGMVDPAPVVGVTGEVSGLHGDHGTGVDLYQAFVGGALLHVMFHQSRRDHRH